MSPAGQPILAVFRPADHSRAIRHGVAERGAYWIEYRSTGLQALFAFVSVGSAKARTYH